MDNLFPKDLYHSYIVEGEPEIIGFGILRFLEERGEIKKNSPDVLMRVYDSFTIDDSHKIKEWHSEMKITDGKRICIIGTNFINHDAERTLLKIIEEPAINTHFFIIVPNSSILLDTIRSRAHIVKIPTVGLVGDLEKVVNDFISMNSKNRIDFIAKMIKESKDDESNSNLRFVAIQFINEIEKNIFKKFKKDKSLRFVLEELQKSRDFLNSPGASVKMILENLALVI